jgi:hypothetical protein
MNFPRISTRTFSIAGFLFSFAALISTNIYFAASDSNQISGCVNKKTGVLRIASKCTSVDNMITWNKVGPQGLKGETGAQGQIGPQGIKGDTGAQGESGPQGIKGETGAQGLQGNQSSLKAVTLNYVVRLPITFIDEPNGNIANIELAPGANCSPGTVGTRIIGIIEAGSSTTGFAMYNCSATVLVPSP